VQNKARAFQPRPASNPHGLTPLLNLGDTGTARFRMKR